MLRLTAVVLVATTIGWTQAHGLDFGVNIHHGGSPAFNTQRAAVMKQRNFTTARMDLIHDWDQASLRDQVQKIRANGGSVEAVLMTSHQWDHSCNPDLARVEQKAYAEAAGVVNKVKDLIHDFELLNEVENRPEIQREVPRNSAGMSTGPYEGRPCMASLAAALRGMAHAIRDIRASSGLPLRVLFGQSGRDWGLLTYLQRQGVEWDVTSWHVYQSLDSPSLLDDPWWGPGGPYAQLAALGKPVHVNEFNCGETYEAGYENQAGRPVTEKCLKSLARHLSEMVNQKAVRIESIHIYELLDEPEKGRPEGMFGLMYDPDRAKPHLFLYTAFAGGKLTREERREITSRGLMTQAQIDARIGAR
jgi:hypothetical protein